MSTHLRLVAGICVLSTGLLIGSAGGAIAAADTDTGPSAPASSVEGAGPAASQPAEPGAVSATPIPGATLRNAVKNTLVLIGRLGREQAAATNRVSAKAENRTTEKDNPATHATEEAATPQTPDTKEGAPNKTEITPVTKAATNPLTPVSTVVEPMTNAVATVVTVMGTVPAVVAELPTSEKPVADVITSVQEMLTSVIDAVLPLASVPSDLYTLLADGGVATETIGQGAGYGAGYGVGPVAAPAAPLLPPVTPAWPHVLPSSSDIWDARGDVATLATAGAVASVGSSEELSISGAAPLVVQGITPTGVLPVLEHAVRALLVPASWTALAALALPGVGGLLIVYAAGIRIGYRQAKTGLMLREPGIARFARSGPLGVVRSGSLIALRPRAVRVALPAASRAAGCLDHAA